MYLSYIPGRPFSPSIAWCCEGRSSGSFGVVQSRVAGLTGWDWVLCHGPHEWYMGYWLVAWNIFSNLWLIMVNNWNNKYYIWLVVWNMAFIFPYVGNNNPN